MLRFVLSALVLCLSSCLVNEKCYLDSDCTRPRVCGGNGECQFQCAIDSDCDTASDNSHVCRENRCIEPVECTLCAFAHAGASCAHGLCQMGPCATGYHDADGDSADGCEYSCSSTGAEVCDGVDNDCNGIVDENTDIRTDLLNCGQCGRACPTPAHANAVCASGQCSYSCAPGFYDNNDLADDGCEAPECIPSSESCDGRDNDCDCQSDSNGDGVMCGPGDEGVDEGFDKTLAYSCGPYCANCEFPHAMARCDVGRCALAQCDPGWYDADGQANTGCEYACVPSGDERCDSLDNDCNGQIDEGSVCVPRCPNDMVPIGVAYCIDKYEASRSDSTADSSGTNDSIALSRSGVLPWMVNPMSTAHLGEFESACLAAGKHLCTGDEWFAACTGERAHAS